jgi:predicted nuclease of predicted toxin-antitoxin system
LKLKVDENLPAECAEILNYGELQADTVADEDLTGADDAVLDARCQSEGRALVTLDLDFSNIRAYPPAEHAGIIVLRPRNQGKHSVLALIRRLVLVLVSRPPAGELWIVEPDRIRFRVGSSF